MLKNIASFLLVTCGLILIYISFHTKNLKDEAAVYKVPGDQVETVGIPAFLLIPKINVNAKIETIGMALDGSMEVPSSADKVGWYIHGSRPGEKGGSVLAGHVNNEIGNYGVFHRLNELTIGDKIYAVDQFGIPTSFEVRKTFELDPGYADEIFSYADGAYLSLVTCSGYWDIFNDSYSKRFIVVATKVQSRPIAAQ